LAGSPGSAGTSSSAGTSASVAGAAGAAGSVGDTGGSAGTASGGANAGGSAGTPGSPSGGTDMMVPPDTTAPSTPGSLDTLSITDTSVTLTWTTSTDNVGVTGYRLFNGDTQVTTVTGTIHTFKNLSPGTAYTFGVDAYDAADNHSARATKGAVTTGGAACDATTKVVTLSHAQSYSVNGTACIELTTNPAWGNVDVLLEQTAGTTISYTFKACNGNGMGTIATDAHLYVGANPNCSFYVQLTGSGTVTYYD
jgi:chitodextrinase